MELKLSNLKVEVYSSYQPITSKRKAELTQFMLLHYNPTPLLKQHIQQAMTYALKDASLLRGSYSHGGIVLIAVTDDQLVGGLIANRTGLMDFLPQTLVSFIATETDYRQKGIAGHLIEHCKKFLPGTMAIVPDQDQIYSEYLKRKSNLSQNLFFI